MHPAAKAAQVLGPKGDKAFGEAGEGERGTSSPSAANRCGPGTPSPGPPLALVP